MNENEVPVEEVKRYFLLANALKEEARHHKELGTKILMEEYKRELDYLMSLDNSALSDRITDKVRLERYDALDWFKGIKSLENMGSWPKMSGLDINLTTGNIPETAKRIRNVKTKISNTGDYHKFKRENALIEFIKKSESIREIIEFIYDRFPIILFPGGEVREKEYNNWARENHEPLCEIFDFDIDDGGSRAVSYALEGEFNIPVYFGQRPSILYKSISDNKPLSL